MIRVQRGEVPAARTALARINRHGLTERDAALWHYSGVAPSIASLPPKPTKAPIFAAYRDDAVKEALHALFMGRCAYCESQYAHIAPMDVEHYRPKAGYLDEAGKLRKPGYYWLAADWDNLLPSCNDCNRERKQVRHVRDNRTVKSKSGKANKFPLAEGSQRAMQPGMERHEVPLLLNPCADEPDRHLLFRSDGFVEPTTTDDECATPKGLTSIDVYGLDRDALVGARRGHALRIESAMHRVIECDVNVRVYPKDLRFEAQRTSAEAALNAFLDGEFQAMARALIAHFSDVRAAIGAYCEAENAWRVHAEDNERAAVATRARVLLALVRTDTPYGDFARGLIEQAGIALTS